MNPIDTLKLLEKQLTNEQEELQTVRGQIKNIRNVLIELETDLIAHKLNEDSLQSQIEMCKAKLRDNGYNF